MKVSDLRKYRKNIEALEAIDRLLDGRIVVDNVQGSHGAPDYALGHCKIEGYGKDKGTIALLREKAAIQKEQAQIKEYIYGIRDRRVYQALKLYCMDGNKKLTWEQVAEQMGESVKALKIAIHRYFCEK